MNQALSFVGGIATSLIGLAMLSVILSPKSQATALIKESASAFTSALSAARGSQL